MLRHIFLLICLFAIATSAFYIYDIYGLRGRALDYDDTRISIGPQKGDSYSENLRFEYHIKPLNDSVFYCSLTNNSISPYFFWLYEYQDWKKSLPSNMVLKYATGPSVFLDGRLILSDKYPGFDCGTGVGVTIVRPFETFADTLQVEELCAPLSIYSFVREVAGDSLVNLLTYDKYSIEGFSQQTILDDITQKVDSIEVEFVLPVVSYFDNDHSYIKSNRIKLSTSFLR